MRVVSLLSHILHELLLVLHMDIITKQVDVVQILLAVQSGVDILKWMSIGSLHQLLIVYGQLWNSFILDQMVDLSVIDSFVSDINTDLIV